MIYLLNGAILTNYGQYSFEKIPVETVTKLLKEFTFTSAIGHEATAKLITELTGVYVPLSRIQVTLNPGDNGIVFRLLNRLPEGKVLSYEELKNIQYEFGLLTIFSPHTPRKLNIEIVESSIKNLYFLTISNKDGEKMTEDISLSGEELSELRVALEEKGF